LFSYIFLDNNNAPREIMLEFKDDSGWEHRAYWGANRINFGTDGTNSRHYLGELPPAGKWFRLEVPASAVGLEGHTLSGMSFALDAGRATWDAAGKRTASAVADPTPASTDFIWVDDALPPGSIEENENQDSWV